MLSIDKDLIRQAKARAAIFAQEFKSGCPTLERIIAVLNEIELEAKAQVKAKTASVQSPQSVLVPTVVLEPITTPEQPEERLSFKERKMQRLCRQGVFIVHNAYGIGLIAKVEGFVSRLIITITFARENKRFLWNPKVPYFAFLPVLTSPEAQGICNKWINLILETPTRAEQEYSLQEHARLLDIAKAMLTRHLAEVNAGLEKEGIPEIKIKTEISTAPAKKQEIDKESTKTLTQPEKKRPEPSPVKTTTVLTPLAQKIYDWWIKLIAQNPEEANRIQKKEVIKEVTGAGANTIYLNVPLVNKKLKKEGKPIIPRNAIQAIYNWWNSCLSKNPEVAYQVQKLPTIAQATKLSTNTVSVNLQRVNLMLTEEDKPIIPNKSSEAIYQWRTIFLAQHPEQADNAYTPSMLKQITRIPITTIKRALTQVNKRLNEEEKPVIQLNLRRIKPAWRRKATKGSVLTPKAQQIYDWWLKLIAESPEEIIKVYHLEAIAKGAGVTFDTAWRCLKQVNRELKAKQKPIIPNHRIDVIYNWWIRKITEDIRNAYKIYTLEIIAQDIKVSKGVVCHHLPKVKQRLKADHKPTIPLFARETVHNWWSILITQNPEEANKVQDKEAIAQIVGIHKKTARIIILQLNQKLKEEGLPEIKIKRENPQEVPRSEVLPTSTITAKRDKMRGRDDALAKVTENVIRKLTEILKQSGLSKRINTWDIQGAVIPLARGKLVDLNANLESLPAEWISKLVAFFGLIKTVELASCHRSQDPIVPFGSFYYRQKAEESKKAYESRYGFEFYLREEEVKVEDVLLCSRQLARGKLEGRISTIIITGAVNPIVAVRANPEPKDHKVVLLDGDHKYYAARMILGIKQVPAYILIPSKIFTPPEYNNLVPIHKIKIIEGEDKFTPYIAAKRLKRLAKEAVLSSNYNQAASYFIEAAKNYLKTDKPINAAYMFREAASIYNLKLKNYPLALEYELEAIGIFRKVGAFRQEAEILPWAANLFYKLEDEKKAEECYERIKELGKDVVEAYQLTELLDLVKNRPPEWKNTLVILLKEYCATEKKVSEIMKGLRDGTLFIGTFGIVIAKIIKEYYAMGSGSSKRSLPSLIEIIDDNMAYYELWKSVIEGEAGSGAIFILIDDHADLDCEFTMEKVLPVGDQLNGMASQAEKLALILSTALKLDPGKFIAPLVYDGVITEMYWVISPELLKKEGPQYIERFIDDGIFYASEVYAVDITGMRLEEIKSLTSENARARGREIETLFYFSHYQSPPQLASIATRETKEDTRTRSYKILSIVDKNRIRELKVHAVTPEQLPDFKGEPRHRFVAWDLDSMPEGRAKGFAQEVAINLKEKNANPSKITVSDSPAYVLAENIVPYRNLVTETLIEQGLAVNIDVSEGNTEANLEAGEGLVYRVDNAAEGMACDWKGPDNVKRLTFATDTTGKLIRLGGHIYGNIYIGRIYFQDGSLHRVAIKRFIVSLTDKKAKEYQQIIDELKKAEVRLPKMGMVRLEKGLQVGREILEEEEWVQVSQLFGSSKKGSKINNENSLRFLTTAKAKVKIEAVKELTKVANAGYAPVSDLFESFKDNAKGIIVFDLDTLVLRGKQSSYQRAGQLLFLIRIIATNQGEAGYRKFVDVARKAASPEIKAALSENEAEIKVKDASTAVSTESTLPVEGGLTITVSDSTNPGFPSEEKIGSEEPVYTEVDKDIPYDIPWPNIKIFSDTFVGKESFTEDAIRERLQKNFYYRIFPDERKRQLINRVQILSVLPEYILMYFKNNYPEDEVITISIYGSSVYGPEGIPAKDFDITVIIKGDMLEYRPIPLPADFPKISFLSKRPDELTFMVIGEDNLAKGINHNRFLQIRTTRIYNFIPHEVCLLSFRNIVLYGQDFRENRQCLHHNLERITLQITRQIQHKFSKLTAEKTDYQRDQLKQAIIRIHLVNLILHNLNPAIEVNFEEIEQIQKRIVNAEAWVEPVQRLYEELLARIERVKKDPSATEGEGKQTLLIPEGEQYSVRPPVCATAEKHAQVPYQELRGTSILLGQPLPRAGVYETVITKLVNITGVSQEEIRIAIELIQKDGVRLLTLDYDLKNIPRIETVVSGLVQIFGLVKAVDILSSFRYGEKRIDREHFVYQMSNLKKLTGVYEKKYGVGFHIEKSEVSLEDLVLSKKQLFKVNLEKRTKRMIQDSRHAPILAIRQSPGRRERKMAIVDGEHKYFLAKKVFGMETFIVYILVPDKPIRLAEFDSIVSIDKIEIVDGEDPCNIAQRLEEELIYAGKEGDYIKEVVLSLKLADLYQNLGRYDEAARRLRRAAKISREKLSNHADAEDYEKRAKSLEDLKCTSLRSSKQGKSELLGVVGGRPQSKADELINLGLDKPEGWKEKLSSRLAQLGFSQGRIKDIITRLERGSIFRGDYIKLIQSSVNKTNDPENLIQMTRRIDGNGTREGIVGLDYLREYYRGIRRAGLWGDDSKRGFLFGSFAPNSNSMRGVNGEQAAVLVANGKAGKNWSRDNGVIESREIDKDEALNLLGELIKIPDLYTHVNAVVRNSGIFRFRLVEKKAVVFISREPIGDCAFSNTLAEGPVTIYKFITLADEVKEVKGKTLIMVSIRKDPSGRVKKAVITNGNRQIMINGKPYEGEDTLIKLSTVEIEGGNGKEDLGDRSPTVAKEGQAKKAEGPQNRKPKNNGESRNNGQNILKRIAQGEPPENIAEDMGILPDTLHDYLITCCSRLGIPVGVSERKLRAIIIWAKRNKERLDITNFVGRILKLIKIADSEPLLTDLEYEIIKLLDQGVSKDNIVSKLRKEGSIVQELINNINNKLQESIKSTPEELMLGLKEELITFSDDEIEILLTGVDIPKEAIDMLMNDERDILLNRTCISAELIARLPEKGWEKIITLIRGIISKLKINGLEETIENARLIYFNQARARLKEATYSQAIIDAVFKLSDPLKTAEQIKNQLKARGLLETAENARNVYSEIIKNRLTQLGYSKVIIDAVIEGSDPDNLARLIKKRELALTNYKEFRNGREALATFLAIIETNTGLGGLIYRDRKIFSESSVLEYLWGGNFKRQKFLRLLSMDESLAKGVCGVIRKLFASDPEMVVKIFKLEEMAEFREFIKDRVPEVCYTLSVVRILKKLTSKELQIFNIIKTFPGLNREGIKERTGISGRTIIRCMRSLWTKGLIKKRRDENKEIIFYPKDKAPKFILTKNEKKVLNEITEKEGLAEKEYLERLKRKGAKVSCGKLSEIIHRLKDKKLVEILLFEGAVRTYLKGHVPKYILSKIDKQILELARKYPGLTETAMIHELKVNKGRVVKHLRFLGSKGLIEFVSKGNAMRIYLKGKKPKIPISVSEEKVLTTIGGAINVKQSEIQRETRISSGNLTVVIRHLEKEQLIIMKKLVGRANLLSLTKKGQKVLDSIPKGGVGNIKTINQISATGPGGVVYFSKEDELRGRPSAQFSMDPFGDSSAETVTEVSASIFEKLNNRTLIAKDGRKYTIYVSIKHNAWHIDLKQEDGSQYSYVEGYVIGAPENMIVIEEARLNGPDQNQGLYKQIIKLIYQISPPDVTLNEEIEERLSKQTILDARIKGEPLDNKLFESTLIGHVRNAAGFGEHKLRFVEGYAKNTWIIWESRKSGQKISGLEKESVGVLPGATITQDIKFPNSGTELWLASQSHPIGRMESSFSNVDHDTYSVSRRRETNLKKEPHIIKLKKNNDGQIIKPNWQRIFGNNNPIRLDIGPDENLLILYARHNPDMNFIAIDNNPDVINNLSDLIKVYKIKNVRLIKANAKKVIGIIFSEGKIASVLIDFPEITPKGNALFDNTTFAKDLSNCLKIGGEIEVVTEEPKSMRMIIEYLEAQPGMFNSLGKGKYANDLPGHLPSFYWKKFEAEGKKIYCLSFAKEYETQTTSNRVAKYFLEDLKKVIVFIGCGLGREIKPLAKDENNFVIGLEPTQGSYEIAIKSLGDLANVKILPKKIQNWDAGELEGKIDLAYFIFPHSDDLKEQGEDIARKAYSLLKDDAELLIFTELPFSIAPEQIAACEEFIWTLKDIGFSINKEEVDFRQVPEEVKMSFCYRLFLQRGLFTNKSVFSKDKLMFIKAIKLGKNLSPPRLLGQVTDSGISTESVSVSFMGNFEGYYFSCNGGNSESLCRQKREDEESVLNSLVEEAVKDAFSYGTTKSGELDFTDVNELLKDMVWLRRQVFNDEYNAEIRLDLKIDLPVLFVHARVLEVVFQHLFDNVGVAIQERSKGKRSKIKLALRITTAFEETNVGKFIVIKFIDEGIGIPDRGSGIGLTIAKKIIEERLGGKIEAKNKVGKGSIFTIKLLVKERNNPKSRDVPKKSSTIAKRDTKSLRGQVILKGIWEWLDYLLKQYLRKKLHKLQITQKMKWILTKIKMLGGKIKVLKTIRVTVLIIIRKRNKKEKKKDGKNEVGKKTTPESRETKLPQGPDRTSKVEKVLSGMGLARSGKEQKVQKELVAENAVSVDI